MSDADIGGFNVAVRGAVNFALHHALAQNQEGGGSGLRGSMTADTQVHRDSWSCANEPTFIFLRRNRD